MRKAAAIAALVLILVCLNSCFDAQETDDLIHVIAVGVDKGVSDKWRLTLQFPTVRVTAGAGAQGVQQGGQDGGQQGEYMFTTVDAPSFFAGLAMLNATLPKRLNLMHAQIIVFSEETAREGLIGEYITPLTRFREIRRSSHLYVVKGKASEFIKENKVIMGSTISKGFQLRMKGSDHTGYYPHVTLQAFNDTIKSSFQQPIATIVAVNKGESFKEEGSPPKELKTGGEYTAGQLPRTGENKIELWGTAIFSGDKMVGELNGDETRYMLMVRGEFEQGYFTFKDPKKPDLAIPLEIRQTKSPRIKVKIEEKNPVIDIKIQLDADILAIQSGIDYEHPEFQPLLEQSFGEIVREGVVECIKKCQEHDADVFNFGKYASRSFLTIGEWGKYDWNNRFKDAKLNVEIDLFIRRTGTNIKTSPIIES